MSPTSYNPPPSPLLYLLGLLILGFPLELERTADPYRSGSLLAYRTVAMTATSTTTTSRSSFLVPLVPSPQEPHFRRADSDRSGGLSRSEFLALYLAVATERVKKNPLVGHCPHPQLLPLLHLASAFSVLVVSQQLALAAQSASRRTRW